MIHIIHTPAAELVHQRQRLARRALAVVMPSWVGMLLWAWFTPLLQPCGSAACNFTGVIFTPADTKPAEPPAPLTPVLTTCRAAEPEIISKPMCPSLASLNPPTLPELPGSESDENPFETDAEALLTVRPQEQTAPVLRPQRSTTAARQPATDSYSPPAYDRCPQPPYPSQLRQRRIQGSVTLTINVAADGAPTAGEITQSSGSAALDRHALNWMLRHWHFTPAHRNGYPCESRILSTMHFTL